MITNLSVLNPFNNTTNHASLPTTTGHALIPSTSILKLLKYTTYNFRVKLLEY